MMWVYLQHVVNDVQFNNRLSPDQVVHHWVIHIAHHRVTQHHYKTFQHITHLCWLEQTGATNTQTHTHFTWIKCSQEEEENNRWACQAMLYCHLEVKNNNAIIVSLYKCRYCNVKILMNISCLAPGLQLIIIFLYKLHLQIACFKSQKHILIYRKEASPYI